MHISRSDIIESTAGRDKGRLFYVLETDGEYALIADGKIRRTEKPKRKKLKHLRLRARPDSHVAQKIRNGEVVLNSELRRDLAIQTFQSLNQGGD